MPTQNKQSRSNKARRALIISAGGSRGAFAVGAIRALSEASKLNFDLVAGSSTGALIAPLAAIGDIETLVEIYSNTTTKQVIRKRCLPLAVLFGNSLYDTKPLQRLIETFLPDHRAEQVLSGKTQVAIAATQLQSGKVTFFANGPVAPGDSDHTFTPMHSPALLRSAMLASCNQPILMPPITIGDYQYMDGGVRDISPVQIALMQGIRDITIINMTPAQSQSEQKRYDKILPIMGRALRLMLSEITEGDFEEARLKGAKLTIVRPDHELNTDPMVFDPTEMRAMMQKGYAAAKALR